MKPLVSAVLVLLAVPSLAAVGHAPVAVPSNLDALGASAVSRPVPGPLSPAALQRVAEGQVSSIEERLGVPTFFWAARRDQERTLREVGLSPVEAARRHLFEYGELYRQRPAALAEATLNKVHDIGQGAIIVSFTKQVEGVPVFRDELKVIMDRDLRLVALSGYLAPFERMEVRGQPQEFLLAPQTAVGTALFDLTGVSSEPADWFDTGRMHGDYRHYTLARSAEKGVHFSQPPRARKVLFTVPDGLVPAYYVELDVSTIDAEGHEATKMFSYVVSAMNGELLFRKDLTAYDAFTYNVWADANGLPWDGPHGTQYSPHPTGTPSSLQTQYVSQASITLEHGPISTQDVWLPSGSTETVGNNIDAYADIASPDGFTSGDVRAQVTSANSFGWIYDSALQPTANTQQRSAAVTQLFVDNNFFHDWFYDAGFNEAAGNAQQDNYGRGGLGNDSMRVEAQDFSGRDNANMSTPADGSRPRMQMYVFSGSSTQFVKVPASNTQYSSGSATFGPENFDLTATAELVNDGTSPAADGCTPFSNVTGKIAVVDRGNCTFVTKVKNAQDAGAVGLVLINNQSGAPPTLYGNDATITIPSLSITNTHGATLKTALGQGAVTLQLYRQASLDRDGTLDNAIVAHEWGHYISNRLIGNANGLNNTQGVGMGEGWGDFHALLVVVRPEDALVSGNQKFEGVYGLSTFVTTGGSGPGLYFGIRRVPYSTDFTKNALTFKHIQDGVPLPKTHPVQFGASGANNSQVHSTGEIWATMLWESYAALLNDTARLTFQQAQDRMRQYLVAGYKGTPNSPTFLEARDAILAAAFANDPKDFQLIWAAFARRGAGQKAVAPSRWSQNNSPVTEDFGAGNQLFFVGAELTDDVVSCDNDGILDNGETGTLTVTLRNSGTAALSQTTGIISSSTPGVTFGNGGQLVFGASQPFGVTMATAQVKFEGPQGIAGLEFQVSYSDPALDGPAPAPVTVEFRGNVEEVAMGSATDDVEAKATLWTVGFNPQLNTNNVFERREVESGNHLWFGPNPDSPADVYLVSPELKVAAAGNLVVSFKHRYDFESDPDNLYDGGVLELQVDGGGWVDVGQMASPGYDGNLAGSPSSNPLRGRAAYAGKSENYPAFTSVTVDLGSQYAGKNVRFRFRIGADDAAAHKGWEVDDIGFAGIEGTPFTLVRGQTSVCGNTTPVASAGESVTVNEREEVTLTGTGTDTDGDTLTFTWKQVEGPTVALVVMDNGQVSFTAPDVTEDTNVGLSLTVNDGKEDSAPSLVNVTVLNVNHAPTASVTVVGTPEAGQRITLDASASADADGDALTFKFTQTAGPQVVLEGGGSAPVFTVPLLEEDAVLRFEVVVNDGTVDSAPAIAEVTLRGQATTSPGGCGCAAGAGAGTLPLWFAIVALAALFGRRRIA